MSKNEKADSLNKVWYHGTIEAILDTVKSISTGLTTQEATLRLARDGPNELTESIGISPLSILLR